MEKKLKLKRHELVGTEAKEVEGLVVVEVAVNLEETVVVGLVFATIAANKGIWQGIAIEMATVEMSEEGLVEAKVVVAEEEAATIVGEMVTWLGNVLKVVETAEVDIFLTRSKQILHIQFFSLKNA